MQSTVIKNTGFIKLGNPFKTCVFICKDSSYLLCDSSMH